MIFVDTGAWIALTDRADHHHKDSVATYKTLRKRRERFVTTDYVIDETVTRLRYDTTHQTAVAFLDLIEAAEKAGSLEIVRMHSGLLDEAVRIFRKYDTAVLSFTDCCSFAVCRSQRIDAVLGFDKHFAMMGFTLLVLPGS